jgi:hypothetical protein
MRLVFLPVSFWSGLSLGILLSLLLSPSWKYGVEYFGQAEFSNLTFKCDNAMRVHFVAKNKVAEQPNELSVQELKASEIGLLDCQEYDLYRKKLIRWGLSENEVSEMALRATEAKGKDLREVIKTHEIRY